MNRRTALTLTFLALTGVTLGWEFGAGLDGSPDTQPWTHLLRDYVPEEITMMGIAILTAWLPVHFRLAYASRPQAADQQPAEPKTTPGRIRKFLVVVALAAGTALGAALTDDKITRDERGLILAEAVAAAMVYFARNNGERRPPEAVREVLARRGQTP